MKFFKIFTIILLISLLNKGTEAKIKIKYKINEEIITNFDVINEKNYLIFLRPNLKDLSNNEILKISEKSLIREIIKKKEVTKVFRDINNKLLVERIKNKLFNFKNVKNEKEFLDLLNNTSLDYDTIIDKMKYEAMWNELIFQKYNSLLKINREELKFDLINRISKNKKFEYNLSELLFEIDKNENYETKYNKILKYINSNDFKIAASRFSITDTAKKGGEIGWIKETLLSKNLNMTLKNMNTGEITLPIKYPSGYLLLKINDKKEMKQVINLDKELDELISFEKNKQLGQFSLLYYKKLRQNTIIDEY